MKGKTLKYIVLLATITVAGVLALQFFFLRNSYDNSEKQFRESTTIALKEVAWQLLAANGAVANFDSIAPVELITNSYYVVTTDALIDFELLKFHLMEELKKHQIYTDFEFAVNNPVTGHLEQKTLITARGEEQPSNYTFPEGKNPDTFYFAVHFPDRSPYFHSRLSVWYLFTGLLVVVILFFGYTLSVIIRQRQLSQIQKNFINNLTHELKTPISSIALSAKVISDEQILKTPKRLFEYARIIQDQNARMSKNVEKVLNLASLEKSKVFLNLEKIELEHFFEEVTKSFRHTNAGKKATVQLNLPHQKIFLVADKFHFTNLVLNILENSVKYCEKKPIIHVDTHQLKNKLLIHFTDNGIGISKKYRKKIFTRFYRVPTGNVHNVKGFGLGLDYVRKIAKAHKWKIKVDDNPEGGSIFTLIISKKI
ncbi:two-component system, OmpR family, phosphate regulon sensor histidine kinase PhoR [Mariniphaga anaerophila]|uniref:histidine kinase n=1 Tax=Mariniphaga anaerophila TaxID=1484053 RepID=A0A1M4VEH3_9BACT|nr:HAMP domain-containing sensor histidine kinase [Mariniphaga anaerophila]SHE67312.1 two-component system, OmpR family, phosphate regulon sensor histidine kinase PhoR [Mariniphaga anaerophila]